MFFIILIFSFAQTLVAGTPFENQKRIAKSGDAMVQNLVGKSYYNGNDEVAQDFVKAMEWFKLSANQVYAATQYNMD